ncbi:hypothetical protein [Cohaesibacter gelatinilyticus]|uniref:Uncharacterized protein n=1 Tax=Cohaesibacter gelatinilyticus TaxID=372072 RepID=A0A285NEA5_9HYPH|nr:hypothetical protein [Cohaesibacter gelatinilyticus]SNZ07233.1 hypothetical protein SAMN06265368_0750 [Cohaesibacter gelatinilyticus]HAT85623.1 hypothetical protein [Hyphomicrobiales bacterium]
MTLRKSNLALSLLGIGLLVIFAMMLNSLRYDTSTTPTHSIAKSLVHQLGLTDLALFTEARYTRHPTQADLHTAFQDHPVGLDHFPSGSLIAPPPSFGPGGNFANEPVKE